MPDVGAQRARNSEATRLDLLKAAQRRFVLLGYERTTTRDIARDAGVNLTLINRYFGSKQGLFQAVVEAAPALLVENVSYGDLVEDFLDGLGKNAWADFGGHPLLLLLRDSSADDQIQALRTQALHSATDRILQWSGIDPGRAGTRRRRGGELRAQLILSLFCGVIALRSTAPIEPIASAGADDLRDAVTSAVQAIITSD